MVIQTHHTMIHQAFDKSSAPLAVPSCVFAPVYTLDPSIRLPPSKRGHTHTSWPKFRGRDLPGAVTNMCGTVCAGGSELTAIVCAVLAAVLLVVAVTIPLVWCKRSKRDKHTSKR